MNVSNIITREQTKKLVRKLPKSLSKKESLKYMGYTIFFDGNKRFEWADMRDNPDGVKNIWLPMMSSYNKQEDGSHERMALGRLDELFYRAINQSSWANIYKKVADFENGQQLKLNQQLKHLNIGIQDGKEFDYMYTSYRYESHSPLAKREGYQELNGVEMGRKFIEYLATNDYPLQEVEDKSQELMMFIRLEVKNYELFGEFIRAVKAFDKYLQG